LLGAVAAALITLALLALGLELEPVTPIMAETSSRDICHETNETLRRRGHRGKTRGRWSNRVLANCKARTLTVDKPLPMSRGAFAALSSTTVSGAELYAAAGARLARPAFWAA